MATKEKDDKYEARYLLKVTRIEHRTMQCEQATKKLL